MSQVLELPAFAIIPFRVLSDKNISEAAKIHFGILTGLSHTYGYCWATDEQLAQLHQTSKRTVENWNRELSDAGHIIRDTENVCIKKEGGGHQWVKKRKIYTNDAVSKKLSETTENGDSDGSAKNGDSDGTTENGGYKDKPLIENPKKTKAAPKEYLSVRENLKLTQEQIDKLKKIYSPEDWEKILDQLNAYRGANVLPKASNNYDYNVLSKGGWKHDAFFESKGSPTKGGIGPKTDKLQSNRELAAKLEKILDSKFGVNAFSDKGYYFCLDIQNDKDARQNNRLNYDANGFREQLESALRKKYNLSFKELNL